MEDGMDPGPGELAERIAGKISTAIVIAAAIVGLAIYARPAPPRFEAIATQDGRIVRVDGKTGTLIACDPQGCVRILRRDQLLQKRNPAPAPKQDSAPKALPKPAAGG